MIRDQELRKLHEDFRCLLQISNPDPQEDVRLKKICTAIMTLSRRLAALNDRENRNHQDLRMIIDRINEGLAHLERRLLT
jgi:hypothetical protein